MKCLACDSPAVKHGYCSECRILLTSWGARKSHVPSVLITLLRLVRGIEQPDPVAMNRFASNVVEIMRIGPLAGCTRDEMDAWASELKETYGPGGKMELMAYQPWSYDAWKRRWPNVVARVEALVMDTAGLKKRRSVPVGAGRPNV